MTYTPEELRAYRKRKGWSQFEAAKQFGVSLSSYHNYERGSRREDGRPVICPDHIEIITSWMATVDAQNMLIKLKDQHIEILEKRVAMLERKEMKGPTQ